MSKNQFLAFSSRYSLQILLAWLAAYLLVKLWGSGTFIKRFLRLTAAGYVLVLLYVTLLSREIQTLRCYQLEPLWEYRQAFKFEAGKLKIQDMEYARYIANNILLFIPLGVLLSDFSDTCGKNTLRRVLPASCLVSASLEISQLVFRIGLFEFDDILNNSIGAVIGFCFYALAEKLKQSRNRS